MKILGYEYKVMIETDRSGDFGSVDVRQQIIRIAHDQTRQAELSAVLHEIIEALAYHLNLELPSDKNTVIMPLEAGLYQVLTDAGVDLSPLMSEYIKVGN
jgi:hypothetical protein